MLETVGELNIHLFDFYAMTWNEWCYYSNGLHKSKIKEWEHTRVIAWMIYRSNSDAKKAATDMHKWWPLATDIQIKANRKKSKRLTQQQKEDFFNSMR